MSTCRGCGEPGITEGHVCNAEFSVCQFFLDGAYEYVCRFVPAAEAVRVFKLLASSLGARIGTTRRVIITDGGDCTNAEWEFGKGLTYPPQPTSTEEGSR